MEEEVAPLAAKVEDFPSTREFPHAVHRIFLRRRRVVKNSSFEALRKTPPTHTHAYIFTPAPNSLEFFDVHLH